MKRSMVILAACCFSLLADAQLVRGSKVLGGGITYHKTAYTDYLDSDASNSNLSFGPSFGYFVSDDLAVGLNLLIQSSTTEIGGNKTKVSAFGIGPFVRYYKHTSNENFTFIFQGGLLYISGKENPPGDITPDIKSSAFDIAVSPGFAYFFNQHWSAELMFRGIGVTLSDPNKDADNDNETDIDIGLNSLSPSIGVRYYFK